MNVERTTVFRYVRRHEQWRWQSEERLRRDIEFLLGDANDADPVAQAMLYALMPITPSLDSLSQTAMGDRFLRWSVGIADGYRPNPAEDVTALSLGGALAGGLLNDLGAGRVRGQLVLEDFGELARLLRNSPQHWARHSSVDYDLAVFSEARMRFGDAIVTSNPGHAAEIGFLNQTWQRIHWLAECREAGEVVLSSRSSMPFPSDAIDCFALVHRLAWNQPLLRRWPELGRFIPREPRRIMEIGPSFGRSLGAVVRREDEALERRFTDEALHERRYALDHVAVMVMEEAGIKEIVLAPERREGRGLLTGFLIDHRDGVFFGETLLDEEFGRPLNFVPLCDTLGYENDPVEPGLATPRELLSTFGLVTAAAWRDLVVPHVRDEQYEVESLRRAKNRDRGRRRTHARGDVSIVRYLPRRIAARQAQVEQAREAGQRTPPRRYPVGAHTRRLPEGQSRSDDAEQYAKEIGIPLAPYQTVVHPHWRGGTEEERQLNVTAEIPQQWRSWSALDVLRTRDR